MTMKTPLTIIAKACWKAKRAIAVNIPAPAKSVIPRNFNVGIVKRIKIIAPRKMRNVTAFFKKLNWVASIFSFFDEILMNLSSRILRIFEIRNATINATTEMMVYLIYGNT